MFPRILEKRLPLSRSSRLPGPLDVSPFRQGFTLVAVLAILALLMVLILSISAVTRVETRASASAKNLLIARNNAIIGLQTAIGQLQLYAGKDQAVTFPATTFYPTKDINLPAASYPAQGRGELFDDGTFGYRQFAQTSNQRSYLDQVETYLTPNERENWDTALQVYWNANKHPHWVGVMDSSLRVDRARDPNAQPGVLPPQRYELLGNNTKFGEPKRDQIPVWLVSGNERFLIDQESGQVTGADGSVVATNEYPVDYQTPLTDIPNPAPDNNAVWLVGEGSATVASDSSDGLDGRVKVRKQEIKPDAQSTTRPIGHYAYWIGDESTKANFAARDPYTNASPGSVEYRNRLQSPQRIGWENITGFDSATFNANDARLLNVSSSRDIALLEATNTEEIQDAAQGNFHHLTAHSKSLLTDAVLGGLKSDLTRFLAGGAGPSQTDPIADPARYTVSDARFRAWGGSNDGFPNTGATALDGIPTWGQVKDWYDRAAAGTGGSISPDPDAGIGPVLTYLMFNAGWSYHEASRRIRWHWMPCLVLWNPFDVPLVPATYEIELEFSPELEKGFVVKENPSLAELQLQAGADWRPDPSPATDENGDGDPANDWLFKNRAGNDQVRRNPANADTTNITPELEVADGDLADGVTDAFGHLYYRLANPGDPDIHVSYHNPPGPSGALGPTGSRATATRLVPHHDATNSGSKRPIKRTMQFQLTSGFSAGEALVFSLPAQQQWTKGAPIPLVNDYVANDPKDMWFDVLEVVNGPASAEADGLKWMFYSGATGFSNPKVTITVAGHAVPLFETEAFGDVGSKNPWDDHALGEDYHNWRDANKTGDADGDGVLNDPQLGGGEPMPKFLQNWRPLYDFSNFAANVVTDSGRATQASNWGFSRTWIQPLTGETGGSIQERNLHRFAPVMSRSNFAASYQDLHPLVEAFRNRNDDSNYNHLGQEDGLSQFFNTRFSGGSGDKYVQWDEEQTAGTSGFPLLTFKDVDGPYKGVSQLMVRNARRAQSEILSLGQFQQVNLSRYHWQPAFPIGNSWAAPYTDREAIAGLHSRPVGTDKNPAPTGIQASSDYPAAGYRSNNADQQMVKISSPNGTAWRLINTPGNTLMDLSYLLNENLWDRYFLSTIVGTPNFSDPLPNSRLRFTSDAATAAGSDVTGSETAAAYLENWGALNVNSTSVEAWKALLTAFRDLKLATGGSANPAETVPVSRTLDPTGAAIDFAFDNSLNPTIDSNHIGSLASDKDYSQVMNGFRYLTDGMIQVLAERIVDEVRLRGPFLSLADFVNRRLVAPQGSRTPGSDWFLARTVGGPDAVWDNDNHPDYMKPSYDPCIGLQGLSGSIQRAIQTSGINGGVNDPRLGADGNGVGSDLDMIYTIRIRDGGDADDSTTSYSSNGIGKAANAQPGNSVESKHFRHTQEPAMRSHLDSEHVAGAPVGEAGQLFDGAPGFVTQGDLLAMIGPALNARGDTFLVRSYGDALDSQGRVLARAYLEAVVQRLAAPVQPAGSAGQDRWRYTDKFGRRFEVVKFRWINPEDL